MALRITGDDGPEADAGPDNPNDVSLTVPKEFH
jgi:hypothetical protein